MNWHTVADQEMTVFKLIKKKASSLMNGLFPVWGLKPLAFFVLPLLLFLSGQARADYNANDDIAAAELQAAWYPGANGLWADEPWWNQAEVLESILNTVQRTNGQSYMNIIGPAWSGNSSSNFITNANDDTEWWGNVWIRGYDLTGNTSYLNTAVAVFNEITTQWDGTCNGGVWWNQPGTYKNAITNELFLLLCTRLHERTPGDTNYLNWAIQEWNWFSASGMINGQSLINDGLNTSTCSNNGQTTWTYNQGVILAGLTELYKITGNAAYLTQAESIANAVIANMVDGNGILYEPCGTGCNGDQVQFKGIFMRYLFVLYNEDHNQAYYNFLAKNAQSIWNNDRNGSNQFGALWSGPFDSADPTRQNSAMDPGAVIADPWTSTMTFVRGAQDPEFNHNVGYATGSFAWACDPTTNPTGGFMQWGPYVSYLPAGSHSAHFRLAVNSLSSSAASLVQLQVTTNGGGTYLGTVNVPWNAFTQAGVPQDFVVPFTNSSGNALEFRVNWNAVAGGPQVILTDTSVDRNYNWFASNLSHVIGRLDGNNNWEADSNRDGSGYMIEGPGTTELGNSNCQAIFELKVDNFGYDSNTVATLSVFDDDTESTVTSQNITRNQFTSILFQDFTLNFTTTQGHHYEYQVYYDSFAHGPRLTDRGVYTSILSTNPTPTASPTPVVSSTWRVNAGGPGYTDTYGNVWSADTNYVGGTANAIGGAISGTANGTLYDTQRYGAVFRYVFNVPPGSYAVFLKFAETYGGDFGVGDRFFNVSINGSQVLSSLDIFAKVGANAALEEDFYDIAPSGGAITIQFTGVTSKDPTAVIEAIGVIPQPTTPTPMPCSISGLLGSNAASTGNYSQSGWLESSSYPLSQAMTVTSMEVYVTSASLDAVGILGIYADNSGSPGTLLVQSHSQAVTAGWNLFPITPTRLAAGNYWLGNSFGGATAFTGAASGTSTADYMPYVFNNSLPSTYNYIGQHFNMSFCIYANGCLVAIPTPTATLTNTVTNTATITPTYTVTATVTNTVTNTLSPTVTSTPTGTATNTQTNTPTATATPTPTITATNTLTATPSSTSTSTSTFTQTNSPTNTSTTTSTNTSTNTVTATPSRTSTGTPISTSTSTQTNMPTHTATNTATNTPSNSSTNTITNTSTFTPTTTATNTPTHSPTGTSTSSPTASYTNTVTGTPTNTLTLSATATVTHTFTITPTDTATIELVVVISPPYPNPSRGLPISFNFSVPGESTVTMEVFTLSFRKIASQTQVIYGDQTLQWDLKDLSGVMAANGVYYVRVHVAGSSSATKILKVLILR